jgi:MYXO-CTERM domain-containing protein
VCGWLASAGHRENILLPHREIGVGRADTAQCFGRYWAQGFGARRTSRGPVAAASAVRFGAQFEAASVRFAAAYDDDAGPPKRALAVVDGACAPLQLAFGAPERGLYWGGGTFTAGECVPYWFLFETASGGRAVWPPSGALVFGADCPDAQPERPPAQCEGPNACAPDGAHRGCYAGPAGTEGVGECRGGVQHCEFGGWGACRDGVVPRAEACNGLDDDCDRETDEGDPESGGSCDTGLKGACAAGHLECRGGGLACLGDRAPAAETCNGEDDDCDGAVDDGLGQIACGEGACRRLVPACEGGAPVPCVAGVPAASDACGDGIDQDCDGVPDDGCACAAGAEQPCYSSPFDTLSRGACAPGRQTCAAGGWGACAGETPPRPEACNGLDDDCDGATDEGLGRVRCGVGGCAVVMPACEQGAPAECRPLSPRPESCDGRDDNCDGVVDEGCFCREGTARPCYPGPSGTLGIGACREGLTPCRGGRWDGCEDAVVPGDERCGTGMDEDCDGETDEVGCTQGEALPPPREPPGCGCGTRVESGSESGAALGLLAFTFAWGARRRRSGKSRPPVRPGLHS